MPIYPALLLSEDGDGVGHQVLATSIGFVISEAILGVVGSVVCFFNPFDIAVLTIHSKDLKLMFFLIA